MAGKVRLVHAGRIGYARLVHTGRSNPCSARRYDGVENKIAYSTMPTVTGIKFFV